MTKLLSLLILCGFCSVAISETIQLNSFDALLAALQKGETVRAVMHYGKCKLTVDGKTEDGPNAVGGMPLLPFEYFAPMTIGNKRGFISCSETVLISKPSGYVYNYVKMRIFDDNTVEINARYLTPGTFEVKMDETFSSPVNDGKNDAGVYFYQLK